MYFSACICVLSHDAWALRRRAVQRNYGVESVFKLLSLPTSCVWRTVGTLIMVHGSCLSVPEGDSRTLEELPRCLDGGGTSLMIFIRKVPMNSPSACKVTLQSYSHLLHLAQSSRLSTPVQNRQAGRWQCIHPQGGVGNAAVGPPTASRNVRIIFSFNTPFCTSAPAKSS